MMNEEYWPQQPKKLRPFVVYIVPENDLEIGSLTRIAWRQTEFVSLTHEVTFQPSRDGMKCKVVAKLLLPYLEKTVFSLLLGDLRGILHRLLAMVIHIQFFTKYWPLFSLEKLDKRALTRDST